MRDNTKIIFISRIKTNKQSLCPFLSKKRSLQNTLDGGRVKKIQKKRTKLKNVRKESTTCVKFRTPKPTQLSPKGVGYSASPASLSDVTTHLSQPQLAGSAIT
ncbi:hypothetical protein CDAR_460221 [Caerostris darwini]|uniref:Uncharacterized protein n=1 Tax=Caerostris darwini TaxID=1538125 RepID=A0AAV4RB82_9ARAC|nr:hypothetical protein CDAR_460221 [Caerostris darwini]